MRRPSTDPVVSEHRRAARGAEPQVPARGHTDRASAYAAPAALRSTRHRAEPTRGPWARAGVAAAVLAVGVPIAAYVAPMLVADQGAVPRASASPKPGDPGGNHSKPGDNKKNNKDDDNKSNRDSSSSNDGQESNQSDQQQDSGSDFADQTNANNRWSSDGDNRSVNTGTPSQADPPEQPQQPEQPVYEGQPDNSNQDTPEQPPVDEQPPTNTEPPPPVEQQPPVEPPRHADYQSVQSTTTVTPAAPNEPTGPATALVIGLAAAGAGAASRRNGSISASSSTDRQSPLTEQQALGQMQEQLDQGLIDPDIDGDGIDDTPVFVKTLWDEAHQNNEQLPNGPVTFNASHGPITLSWADINRFADQTTPAHPESVRALLPLPLAPTTRPEIQPWQYNLDLTPTSRTEGPMSERAYVPDLGENVTLDQVWNELHRRFNANFPIGGAPANFPKVGDRFPLTIKPLGSVGIDAGVDVAVYVTQIEKTADQIFIEYASAPGHTDGVGSTISFTFTKADTLHLAVKGIIVAGPGSGDGTVDAAARVFYSGIGQATWQPYVDNLVHNIARFK